MWAELNTNTVKLLAVTKLNTSLQPRSGWDKTKVINSAEQNVSS